MPDPIVFKSVASLWDLMESGEKRFDMRRWDLSDDRIYRLAQGTWPAGSHMPIAILELPQRPGWLWCPVEKQVAFLNKADGRLLTFEYLGMEFARWAPGWTFLILGRRLTGGGPGR